MSDTPRTDNAVPYMDNPYAQSATVKASFARKLERELAVVTAERDALLGDKVRLDWVGDNAVTVVYQDGMFAASPEGFCNSGWSDDVRDAIDDAIECEVGNE